MTDNPLLVSLETLIDYPKVTPEHIKSAMTHLLEKSRNHVNQKIQFCLQQEQITWDNLMSPQDDTEAKLFRAWSVAGHLNAVVNTPELRECINSLLPLVSEYMTWLGLNTDLYKCYARFASSEAYKQATPTQKRIIDLGLRNFRLAGVQLEGEKREKYKRVVEQSALASQKFSENCLDATDEWAYFCHDIKDLSGLPDDVIEAAKQAAEQSGKTGWKFTLKAPSMIPVMQYADNRELRASIYKGYCTLASDQGNPKYDNSSVIENLLQLRSQSAHLLGFDNYAAMQLETRMADSSDQVIHFLQELAKCAKPFAQKELEELNKFGKEQLGINDPQPWDYSYIGEKLRQSRYAYSENELRQYFPISQVIKGLKQLLQQLFNIELVPIQTAVWHPEVEVYEIKDGSGSRGLLYTDLFARQGKQAGAWVDSERSRQVFQNKLILPIATLTCNFSKAQGNKPALLTHDDVITLFHETGHALHCLLSEVDEPDASPFNAVEWDAIELPSQFMENFCWENKALKLLSSHWQTQESLPDELIEKLKTAKNFNSGMQTIRQIEFALFDMLLHTVNQGLNISEVQKVLQEVRQEVAVVMPPEWNRFAHNFSHLFAGGYAAGYYSYKWAEVLSADAYSAFEEQTDTSPCENTQMGLHFRREILAVGGSRPAAESFVAFRGRPPEKEALLRHHGLVN